VSPVVQAIDPRYCLAWSEFLGYFVLGILYLTGSGIYVLQGYMSGVLPVFSNNGIHHARFVSAILFYLLQLYIILQRYPFQGFRLHSLCCTGALLRLSFARLCFYWCFRC